MSATATPEGARVGAAALQLRVHGASFAAIAETLGLANSRSAMTLVQAELALNAADDEDLDEHRKRLRAEEDERILAVLAAMMERATDPTDQEQIAAARTALSCIDRRVKLHGLDAPTEVTIHTPTQTELDRWVNTMIEQAMPTQALQEPDVLDAESWEVGDDD